MPGEKIKLKVASNIGAPWQQRYFHNFWTYRLVQMTTSNVKSMKEAAIGGGKNEMVESDIQPHALHRFVGDKCPSVVVAIPRTSKHYQNILECEKASIMCGHTDPQIFHWFKHLDALPPRSIMQGKATLLTPEETFGIWDDTFVKHPLMHELAKKMWMQDESKTPEEKARVESRLKEEDEKRMRRMTNPDWRKKQKEREQNPTPVDDEERPIYIMKSDSFALVKIRPDTQLWASYLGAMKRVHETEFPPMDNLARAHNRFIRTANFSRGKLMASLNLNYNMKLLNGFVFDIDQRGMWAMGTQENFTGEMGHAKENWTELRIEFGKDQLIQDEAEMEWWFKGLFKMGAAETSTVDAHQEDNSEDLNFRHGASSTLN